jgi:serine/threonine protein kinase
MIPSSLLSYNERFTGGDGKSYLIVKKIGEGKTGYVYDAVSESNERPVALKVMRTDISQELQIRFKSESINLRQITDLVRLNNIGVRLVPELIANSDEDPVYLAEELIRGKPIIDIAQKDGTLTEETAVIICWRFSQLLKVLHEKYLKSYADMKFENIWWIEYPCQ